MSVRADVVDTDDTDDTDDTAVDCDAMGVVLTRL